MLYPLSYGRVLKCLWLKVSPDSRPALVAGIEQVIDGPQKPFDQFVSSPDCTSAAGPPKPQSLPAGIFKFQQSLRKDGQVEDFDQGQGHLSPLAKLS